MSKTEEGRKVVINSGISYKGWEIEKWVEEVLEDRDHPEYDIAYHIKHNFYDKNINPYPPARNVYYEVDVFRDYTGMRKVQLIRNIDLSPRNNR